MIIVRPEIALRISEWLKSRVDLMEKMKAERDAK
jgi:hypothetical protein